jgi:hypothetical protein
MTDLFRLNRLLQIFYPAAVFLLTLLAWNTAGHSSGYGDDPFRSFSARPNDPNRAPAFANRCASSEDNATLRFVDLLACAKDGDTSPLLNNNASASFAQDRQGNSSEKTSDQAGPSR